MIRRDARIFVATASIDFRGSFDRLAGFVRSEVGEDPSSGAFFVFFNRTFNRAKIYFVDRTGDCVFYKRLDQMVEYVHFYDLDLGEIEIIGDAVELVSARRFRRAKR